MIGGIIGGAVALVVILIAVVLLVWRSRKRGSSRGGVGEIKADNASHYAAAPLPHTESDGVLPGYSDVSDVRSTGGNTQFF
jgi:hypothetical protein